MTSIFTEIPIALVREDSKFPDLDQKSIYDHLKHVLSLPSMFPLPALHVVTDERGFVVTRRHKCLRIARELGLTRIRAILSSRTLDEADLIARLPDGCKVVPIDEINREAMATIVKGYHVYFFERPLKLEEKCVFQSEIIDFFEKLESPLLHDVTKRVLQWRFPFGASCGEFEAYFPIGDHSWFATYLATAREFSKNVARIVSFQGEKFLE